MEFNYENWLLNALYGCANELGLECKIEISSERSFAMPEDKSTLLFIVKRLSGSVLFDSIKVQPVQIICYTEMSTMDKGMQVLDLFTKLYNNNSFTQDGVLIKQTYDTVVSLRPFVATENSFRASLYTYGSITSMNGIADISEVQWYDSDTGEWLDVKPITFGLSYVCAPNTQNVSNSNLSTTEPQDAALTISISLIQNDSKLVKTLNYIAVGLIKQRKIKFRFKLQGTTIVHDTIMTTQGLTSTLTDAPSLSLVFQV